MDSEEDFQSFSPLHQSSPQFQPRRLKRLKKNKDAVQLPQSNQRLSPNFVADDDLIPFPGVDFAELQAMEAALDDSNSEDSSQPLKHSLSMKSGSADESPENNKETSLQFDDEFSVDVEDRRDAKRVLNFEEADDSDKLDTDRVIDKEKCIQNNLVTKEEKIVVKKGNKRIDNDSDQVTKEEKTTEKKRKKENNSDDTADVRPGKRKLEKERKEYLKQLHAESQRLLRESTDAAFKPTKVMGKSLTDVLEKMRQRKMQFTKKTASSYINASAEVQEENETYAIVKSVDKQLDNAPQQPEISLVDQLNADCLDVDKSAESASVTDNENPPIQKVPDEKSMPLLQNPVVDDTQDLFGDFHTRDSKIEKLSGHDDVDSPLEEAFVPSLNVLNLKFDSDDSSSEDDNDKENVDPTSQIFEESSRRGDPVKAFLDVEAEEEDDSDHDMLRFPENEDDDMEDLEELNDIIATNYEEKPSDNERRNELHQKWLEQQDAAGTDNLLQKFKVGLNQQENTSIGPEEEENEDLGDHDPEDEDEDDTPLKCDTRVHLRKAKQMICQMFGEKDELYISDEEEEIEKKLVKHRLIVRTEEQRISVSSVQDKSSREVSGLIKKLNIAPENRKKAKASLYFDSVLKGGNDSGFVKSSFVGRFSNNTLPSYHKKSSGSVRSFIFGRDDSNSRSSITASDDSEDAASKGNHSTRTLKAPANHSMGTLKAPAIRSQAKYSSSQSKRGTTEANVSHNTSLFEVLKRSSIKSGFCNREDRLDLTQVISTFKIPK